ncbi:hypothetical protein PR048_011723 [Dryococelus australis]|uniref:Uncharacterized protein n=1 Tax=Dryococelus australis TaxID=614101 RepID=A0ABQ9HMC4_9NEOP|nr:hypothetical protein PR048_011723 [Dryococelus australis]
MRVQETRIHRDFVNDPNNAQIPMIRKCIGHPETILFQEQETDQVDRLTSLSSRGFGHSSMIVRRAVYHYANLKNINTPWSTQRFHFLEKTKCLLKSRAMGLNKEVVDNFYDLLKDLYWLVKGVREKLHRFLPRVLGLPKKSLVQLSLSMTIPMNKDQSMCLGKDDPQHYLNNW